MKFQIRHEIRGRMRIHVIQSRMSFAQADTFSVSAKKLFSKVWNSVNL